MTREAGQARHRAATGNPTCQKCTRPFASNKRRLPPRWPSLAGAGAAGQKLPHPQSPVPHPGSLTGDRIAEPVSRRGDRQTAHPRRSTRYQLHKTASFYSAAVACCIHRGPGTEISSCCSSASACSRSRGRAEQEGRGGGSGSGDPGGRRDGEGRRGEGRAAAGLGGRRREGQRRRGRRRRCRAVQGLRHDPPRRRRRALLHGMLRYALRPIRSLPPVRAAWLLATAAWTARSSGNRVGCFVGCVQGIWGRANTCITCFT